MRISKKWKIIGVIVALDLILILFLAYGDVFI